MKYFIKIGICFLGIIIIAKPLFSEGLPQNFSEGFITQVTLYQEGTSASIQYNWDKSKEEIVFSQIGNVWIMNKDGSGKKLIGKGYHPDSSSDNNLITYDYQDSIWIYNRQKDKSKKIVEGGKYPQFMGDDKIVYLTLADIFRNLWIYDLNNGDNIPLTEIAGTKRIIYFKTIPSQDKILLNTVQLKEFEEGIKIDTLDIELLDLTKLDTQVIVSEGNGGFFSLAEDNSKLVFVSGYTYNPCIWTYDFEKEDKSLISCFAPYFYTQNFVTTFPGYELGEKIWFPMCNFAKDNFVICSNYDDNQKSFYISMFNFKGEKIENIFQSTLPLGMPVYNEKNKKVIFAVSKIRNNQENSALNLFSNVKVLFDDNEIEFMTPPLVKNGVVFLPLKPLTSAFQGYVEWDNSEKKIIIVQSNAHIELKLNQDYAFVNGIKEKLDVAPAFVYNQIYAPARFFVNSFGGKLIWDNKKFILYIYSQN